MSKIFKVAALTGLLLLIWSAIFASTFRYPFFWDDFHLIRSYTAPEIRSAFHAVIDPDKIETPGLRPCSIFLYNFQGTVFGENIVAQHVFMVVLMGIFMTVAGVLLLEVGLGFSQLSIVFALFVSSRIFASLILWISLSHLILAYIWSALTAYLFVLWVKRARWIFLFLMLVTTTLATFTREETYTLPIVLPLLCLISCLDRRQWRRVAIAAFSLLAIVSFHYALWHFLVPDALSPKLNFGAVKRVFTAILASCLPRGLKMVGTVDTLLGAIWIIFMIGLVSMFVKFARPRVRWQFLGVCCMGVLLCLPALAIGRPFGITLPTLAFMTAIAIAVGELFIQLGTGSRGWRHTTVTAGIILGLVIGIGGGLRRSCDVAESLRPNCAARILRDGEFLFQLLDHPATIPEQRRTSGRARLEGLGISSAADLTRLKRDLQDNPASYQRNRRTENGVFVPKYDYLSF
jgi:hypothetical protein